MAKDDPQDPASNGPELPAPSIGSGFLQLLFLVGLVWISWQWVTWPNVKDLVDHNPETTAFIALYLDGGSPSEDRTVDWRWVEYGDISSNLKRAVLVAEDARFFTHHGFAHAEI
jgi:monofunctional biosynthetic peptidoglycan transglycosylase